jgi:hypothetical protein
MDARIKSGHDRCVPRVACETLTSRHPGVVFSANKAG